MEGDKACSSISEGIDFNGRVHQSFGFSSPVGKNLSRKTLHHGLQSSLHSKQFLQLDDRLHPFPARNIATTSFSLRKSRGSIVAAGKQGWDFGRFLKTVYFFNEPPSPAKFFEFLIAKLSSSTSSESVKEMGTTDIILVAGATGGVGRRVVDVLRKKGILVRALGKVPLISGVGINQLHIFIFVLAVTHVLYCIITLVVGRLKVHLASVDMEDAMVRGKGCPWFCIVSQNLSVLNLVIVKKGENDLPGLIEESRIRKELQRPSRGSCKLVISEDVMVVGRESLLENELWEGSCFYVS